MKLPSARAALTFMVGAVLSIVVYRKIQERVPQLPAI